MLINGVILLINKCNLKHDSIKVGKVVPHCIGTLITADSFLDTFLFFSVLSQFKKLRTNNTKI